MAYGRFRQGARIAAPRDRRLTMANVGRHLRPRPGVVCDLGTGVRVGATVDVGGATVSVAVGGRVVGEGIFGVRVGEGGVRVGDSGVRVRVAGVETAGPGVGARVRVAVAGVTNTGPGVRVGVTGVTRTGPGVRVGVREGTRVDLCKGVAGVERGNTLGCTAGKISTAPLNAPPGASGDGGTVCAATGVPNACRLKMSADSRQIVPGAQALVRVFEMGSENPFMISSFG